MRGDHRHFAGESPHAALQQRVVLHGPAALTQNQADDGTRRQRARTAISERRNRPRRHGQDGAREVERSFSRRSIVCHDRALGVACDPVRSVGRSVARCRHYRTCRAIRRRAHHRRSIDHGAAEWSRNQCDRLDIMRGVPRSRRTGLAITHIARPRPASVARPVWTVQSFPQTDRFPLENSGAKRRVASQIQCVERFRINNRCVATSCKR